jgi:hypothetical protein
MSAAILSRKIAKAERMLVQYRNLLEELVVELPPIERATRLEIRKRAAAIHLLKLVGGKVEAYDESQRFIGCYKIAELPLVENALKAAGKMPSGEWPDFAGGRSKSPGLAHFWTFPEDA